MADPRVTERAVIRPQYHFRQIGDDMHIWDVRKLILLDGPVTDHPLDDIAEIDEPYWYGPGSNSATCRAILTHADLISAADLQYPILLCQSGRVIDGMHRVLKAIRENRAAIRARHIQLPAPDYMNRDPDCLPY